MQQASVQLCSYFVHIRALKALNHGLVLKKMHKIIQFNQKHG